MPVITPSHSEPGNFIHPSAWAAGEKQDVVQYGAAEMQVEGLPAGQSISVLRSLSRVGYQPISVRDQNGQGPYTTITADGIYSVRGGGSLQYTQTGGTPASVTLTARN